MEVYEDLPTLGLWDDFFGAVNQFDFDNQLRIFESPQLQGDYVINGEEDVREVFNVNICSVK